MTKDALLSENLELRRQITETQETLSAIRKGEADAIVVKGDKGYSVYTLNGADRPYRLFLDEMKQGAVTLSATGAILFYNRYFSDMIGSGNGELLAKNLSIHDLIIPSHRSTLSAFLERAVSGHVTGNMELRTLQGRSLPVFLAMTSFIADGVRCYCITALDLTRKEDAQPATTAVPYVVPQKHVLIIYYSDDILKILNGLLSDNAMRVSVTIDGAAGIGQAMSLLPDIAIIDVCVSRPNGINAAAKIRAALGSEIFLVALCHLDDVADVMNAGFNAHVLKPVNPQRLLSLLKSGKAN